MGGRDGPGRPSCAAYFAAVTGAIRGSREEICAAIRFRLNVDALPKLEGDVLRVYDRVCQRRERLEDVVTVFPRMTGDAVQAAWDTLRVWAEEDL
jgi:hypothetical protein